MVPVALLALVISVAPAPETGCWTTDYAPDSLALHREPSSKAASIRSVPKGKASSFVRVDGFSNGSQDWVQIRTGEVEGWVPVRYVVCRLTSTEAQEAVAHQASAIVQALKKEDFQSLSDYVHPTKGLLLSPYATVDRKVNAHFSAAELKTIAESPTLRTWGVDDGTGAPIRLTFSKYYSKFMYDRDFATAPKVTYNDDSTGEAKKVWEEFPSASVVNLSFPESESKPEDHLLLSFEEQQGKWYLTAILHAGWTI